ERGDRGRRGRVLDVAVPAARKAEELGQPVEGHRLELRRGGRGAPDEGDRVERGGEELGEDARLRGRGREVREEARVLPVRDPGQEELVEVVEHGRERLGMLRRRGGTR